MLRTSFVVGMILGLGLSVAVPAHAGPAVPVHQLAREAWPYMSDDQKVLVDVMAADLYRNTTTSDQKRRISGRENGRYDSLPDWRKAPFRGIALRQLGHATQDFKRDAI